MSAPLIGVSADAVDDPRGALLTLYQLRSAYVDAVSLAGGLPIVLAPLPAAAAGDVPSLLARLDGVVLTGGAFDVPPALYGEPAGPKLGPLKPERTAFELALLAAAEARGLPVLGICGGMQLMNVARGGSLHQHLPDSPIGHAIDHERPGDRRQPSHSVQLEPSSALAGMIGSGTVFVNSSHHQGVAHLGRELVASARSPDGLVEAFEDPTLPFFVGVEWHPELLWHSVPQQRGVFLALIRAASL